MEEVDGQNRMAHGYTFWPKIDVLEHILAVNVGQGWSGLVILRPSDVQGTGLYLTFRPGEF